MSGQVGSKRFLLWPLWEAQRPTPTVMPAKSFPAVILLILSYTCIELVETLEEANHKKPWMGRR